MGSLTTERISPFRLHQQNGRPSTDRRRSTLFVVGCIIIGTLVPGLPAEAGTLTLASRTAGGIKGNATSEVPSLSGDGTKVAFGSQSTNLHAGDEDAVFDIYVKDLTTGALALASTSSEGVKGDSTSELPSLSEDGTKVAFRSSATNLDPADTDTTPDIYVKDLSTGTLTLASTNASGTKATFSFDAMLSGDGTKVVFSTQASNLDPADADSQADVYVKDLATGALTLASTNGVGTKANFTSQRGSLSGDGTKVAFRTDANNLDPADADENADVYVKDLTTGTLTLASRSVGGIKGNASSFEPTLSKAGTKVAFFSGASNLDPADDVGDHDVYVKDLASGALTLASTSTAGAKGNANSSGPSILSGDGTAVAFGSQATNLDPADIDSVPDVYIKDLASGALTLASTSTAGAKGNNNSFVTALSGDGTKVAFYSQATNLDPGDNDSTRDIFVNVNDVLTSPPMLRFGPSYSVGENIGTASVTVTLSEPDDGTVTVEYDRSSGSATSGTDFTLAAGILTFAPGDVSETIDLSVTDDAKSESAETIVVALSDPVGADLESPQTTTVTIRPSDQRPDGWVSVRRGSRYAGNNVYNSTGVRQTRTSKQQRGRKRAFYARVYNDGNVSNEFRIRGTKSPRGATVKYFLGTTRKNITKAMRSSSGYRITLAPGAFRLIRIEIATGSGAVIGSSKRASMRTTWTGDAVLEDVVKAIVKVVR